MTIVANNTTGKKFSNGTMNIPPPSSLEGCSLKPFPYYLVGDQIFPLKEWLFRPYPGTLTEEQKIFSYHLSKARGTIENSFGILTTRWRIFLTPIKAKVENVESYVQAAVTMHNYLNQTESLTAIQNEYNDGEKVDSHDKGLIPLRNVRGSRYPDNPIAMREALKEYFNSPAGSVEWQLDYVRRKYNIILLKSKIIFIEKQFIIQTGNI